MTLRTQYFISIQFVKSEEYDDGLKDKITGIFTEDAELIDAVRRQIEIFSFYRRHQCYIRN